MPLKLHPLTSLFVAVVRRSGIRRSLSNLFVQQKSKHQKNKTTMESTQPPLDTMPQQNGPLVRLRNAPDQHRPPPHPNYSRQSNITTISSNDGNSADSGYSPTEPEIVLVPHSCVKSFRIPQNDSYDMDKSMESLASSCDQLDEQDDVVDWIPPHMRNRGAVSSPNIPRMMRRVPATVGGPTTQRYRPDSNQQFEERHSFIALGSKRHDNGDYDDDNDDDDDDYDDTDFDASNADLFAPPTGSLCRLSMSTFNSNGGNNNNGNISNDERKPRRVRAVSDHSLHRRSKVNKTI